MVNLIGYSYKDALNILKMIDCQYSLEGVGYVYEQNIKEGDTITDKVTVKLKNRY